MEATWTLDMPALITASVQGGSPSENRTGLHGDVQCGSGCVGACLPQRHHFGVGLAGGLRVPLSDDASVLDHYGAYGGIGAGLAEGLPRQL